MGAYKSRRPVHICDPPWLGLVHCWGYHSGSNDASRDFWHGNLGSAKFSHYRIFRPGFCQGVSVRSEKILHLGVNILQLIVLVRQFIFIKLKTILVLELLMSTRKFVL